MSIKTLSSCKANVDLQGKTIPINHARPNKNLTITKKEPIGWAYLL